MDDDLVADGEGPGDQQDEAGEEVAEGLLAGDADDDAGEGAADQQLADADVEHAQRGDDGDLVADQRDAQADDAGVADADVRLGVPHDDVAEVADGDDHHGQEQERPGDRHDLLPRHGAGVEPAEDLDGDDDQRSQGPGADGALGVGKQPPCHVHLLPPNEVSGQTLTPRRGPAR
ncbi:hypothetical protein [Kutzneria sp. 744]|uniref:hypothetical protein n=1 Tax=Kutzneria sp. (strain 744) TaxID=345341 RepID=UPI001E3439D4|nr:hypothetical protein [Kutzneria sp. 744]